jgi:hypothetical protein
MARLEDIPQPTRDAVANAACPSFETTPFVSGPPLAERRVAIVSGAALIPRNDTPFPFGSAEDRAIFFHAPQNAGRSRGLPRRSALSARIGTLAAERGARSP